MEKTMIMPFIKAFSNVCSLFRPVQQHRVREAVHGVAETFFSKHDEEHAIGLKYQKLMHQQTKVLSLTNVNEQDGQQLIDEWKSLEARASKIGLIYMHDQGKRVDVMHLIGSNEMSLRNKLYRLNFNNCICVS